MSAMLDSRIVTSADALARLEPAWKALWRRTQQATPFQSPAWLLAWWQTFHPGELATATVHLGDRLVAVAPFYIERRERHARLLPIGISLSDYTDILVEPDLAAPALSAVARSLAADVAWDEWELPEAPPEAAALLLAAPTGGTRHETRSSPCPVIALADEAGPRDPLASVPAAMRRKLRMAHHRLARQGAWRLLRTKDRSTTWWTGALCRLHAARWRSRGESGVLADTAASSFLARALPALAGAGLARLHAVEIGGEVAGVYYGFGDGRRAYAYLGGFHPQFAYYSPGTVLIGAALTEAADEGAGEFHFLRGAEAYKYAWGAIDRWNTRLVMKRR